MKFILFQLSVIMFINCLHQPKKHPDSQDANEDSQLHPLNKKIQYSDQQLESFLDSIGKLPRKHWMEKTAFFSDSIFRNRQSLNDSLNPADFKELKSACKSKLIDQKRRNTNPFNQQRVKSCLLVCHYRYQENSKHDK